MSSSTSNPNDTSVEELIKNFSNASVRKRRNYVDLIESNIDKKNNNKEGGS